MANIKPLSPDSSVGAWLDHPVGGAILRDLLARAGQDAAALKPVRLLAIKRLVPMSNGAFTMEMLTELADQANRGELPAGAAPVESPADSAEQEAPEAGGMRMVEWVERPVEGRFAGRTVVVTGAGSGIGRATASRVLREGGRVVGVDISAERLAELAAEFPGGALETVSGDINDPAAIERIVAAAGERIDGLANVAGIMDRFGGLHEVTDEVWTRVFDVNVNGMMRLSRAVLQRMLPAGSGTIVNVASEAGLRGSAAGIAYTASKHAVVGMTKSTAFLYGPRGIRVNAVAPGAVMTNIEARFETEFGEQYKVGQSITPTIAEASQLAASITFLLSDDSVNVNGQILASDGGWSAI